MSVTAWVKRRQGGGRPQAFGLKRLSPVKLELAEEAERLHTLESTIADTTIGQGVSGSSGVEERGMSPE